MGRHSALLIKMDGFRLLEKLDHLRLSLDCVFAMLLLHHFTVPQAVWRRLLMKLITSLAQHMEIITWRLKPCEDNHFILKLLLFITLSASFTAL